MPIIEGAGSLREAGGTGRVKWARADYNFATDGGAVGTIALAGGPIIPAGALILSAYIETTTAVTSAGAATAALQIEAAGDLQAAVVVTGAPWTAGRHLAGARTRAVAPTKTTAGRDVSLVVAVAALTAGAFRVYVEYIEAP